jgi:hypothetical protein
MGPELHVEYSACLNVVQAACCQKGSATALLTGLPLAIAVSDMQSLGASRLLSGPIVYGYP